MLVECKLDKKECDFYLDGELFQVSYDIEDEQTRKREFEGLRFFADKLGRDKGILISYNASETLEYKGIDIEVLRLDEFLMRRSGCLYPDNKF